jgi:Rod binding domain-containing protein
MTPLSLVEPSLQRPAPNTPAPTSDQAAARRAAQEFESVFMAEMLSPVFESLNTDGLMGGGASERMFRPMLVQEYAKAMSQQGGVGIADAVLRELTMMQMQKPEQT